MRTETVFALALRAVTELRRVVRDAQLLAADSPSDVELDGLMRRGRELIAVLEDAQKRLDEFRHSSIFMAVPGLKAKFDALSTVLRRGDDR